MIIDMQKMKYECVLAYCHEELLEAEKISALGGGQSCAINEKNVRRIMKYISKKIEALNCTKKQMKNKALVLPIAKYYNEISKIHDRLFKKNDHYIPSLLVLELLRLYSEKGYSDFSKINFLKYQGCFESFRNEKGLIPKHFKTAENIVKGLDLLKNKRGKKK